MIIDDISWPEDGDPDQIDAFLTRLDALVGHFAWLHFVPDHLYKAFPNPALIERFGEPEPLPGARYTSEFWAVPYADRRAAFAAFFDFVSAELSVIAADERLDGERLGVLFNARAKGDDFAFLYFDSGDLMEHGSLV